MTSLFWKKKKCFDSFIRLELFQWYFFFFCVSIQFSFLTSTLSSFDSNAKHWESIWNDISFETNLIFMKLKINTLNSFFFTENNRNLYIFLLASYYHFYNFIINIKNKSMINYDNQHKKLVDTSKPWKGLNDQIKTINKLVREKKKIHFIIPTSVSFPLESVQLNKRIRSKIFQLK